MMSSFLHKLKSVPKRSIYMRPDDLQVNTAYRVLEIKKIDTKDKDALVANIHLNDNTIGFVYLPQTYVGRFTKQECEEHTNNIKSGDEESFIVNEGFVKDIAQIFLTTRQEIEADNLDVYECTPTASPLKKSPLKSEGDSSMKRTFSLERDASDAKFGKPN